MRLPRFTTRRLMVLVAVVGALLGGKVFIERRRDRFRDRFSYHRSHTGPMKIRTFAPEHPIFETPRGRWHYELSLKYAAAARYPWLPVPPDPPPPD